MADEHYMRLLFDIAELKRKLAAMIRPATVHEVKGDRVRMVVGKDEDGQDVLGPWMDTINHRGGARERRFFKKGQNLMLICPNGDLAQAVIAPFAPNKNFKTPDHANKTGLDEEVYQFEDLRVRKTKDGYAIWLQKPKDDQQQQQDDPHKVTKPPEHEPQEPEARALIQLTNDGGFTGRIGKDIRVAAHKDGAKIKAGSNFAVVTKDKGIIKTGSGDVYVHAAGTPYVNKPWEIKDAPNDPVSDDNKVLDKDEKSSST